MLKTRDTIYRILAEHTGKSLEQITKDCDRDYFLTAEEAKDYKIVDNILERRITLDKK
jgi:ATP-dependent Clp protease protease subunit